jgi:hypothetical protein
MSTRIETPPCEVTGIPRLLGPISIAVSTAVTGRLRGCTAMGPSVSGIHSRGQLGSDQLVVPRQIAASESSIA